MIAPALDWSRDFAAWQAFADRIRAQASRIDAMRHDRGFALAATVGLPRHLLCIHNASIDRDCTGWSAPGPHVHRTARAALRILDDWSATRAADRIIARAWNRILGPHGVPART